MKRIFLGFCCLLSALSGAQAAPILTYLASTDHAFTLDATATYMVNSGGNGVTAQGFSGSPTSSNSFSFALDYSAVANATIIDATLDLSRVLTSGTMTTTRSITTNGTGATQGTQPVFASTPSAIYISISGLLGGTQTLSSTGGSYDLMTYFHNDLAAGNSLTVQVSLGDTFSRTSAASGAWRKTTATYSLTQHLSSTFTAATAVHYVQASLGGDPGDPGDPVPEPLTTVLSGAGLAALVLSRRWMKKA